MNPTENLTLEQRVKNAKRVIGILQSSEKNGGFKPAFLSKMYLLFRDLELAFENSKDPEIQTIAGALFGIDTDGKHGV